MSHAHISSLSIWRDRFIYMSPYFLGEQSCRPSTVILIGTDGDFEVESSGHKHSGRAFLIGSNVARTLSANNTCLYSLNVDPINPYARKLREILDVRDILDLQSRLNETAQQHAYDSMSGKRTCHELRHSSEVILQALFPEIIGPPPLDRRIGTGFVAFRLAGEPPCAATQLGKWLLWEWQRQLRCGRRPCWPT